jgi:disulfide bond formation protein DsbB
MIEFLRRIAAHRLAWSLLAASALFLELSALFFQHVLGLHPCVMCVYERIATLGVLTAGLLGMVAPQKWYVRWSALLLWGSSAFWGLKLALKHVDYQVNPSPSTSAKALSTSRAGRRWISGSPGCSTRMAIAARSPGSS